MMERRTFLTLAAGGLLAAPLAAEARTRDRLVSAVPGEAIAPLAALGYASPAMEPIAKPGVIPPGCSIPPEVLPQVAWTKGECAQWIQARMSPTLTGHTLWLYLGDDWTDEHAFEVLSGQALTSRVGDAVPASKAAYRLQDVSEVHQLLAALAAGAPAGSRV
jgi:hypothetical protein